MMEFLFWFFTALIVYTYVGYPILLFVLSTPLAQKVKKGQKLPTVSIILSAFNEEDFIEQKLRNLLGIDYPDDRIEILVGSDGARDRTDEIVSRFHSARVRFFRFVRNQGKPSVLNSLVREAQGSILVFTDVRQEFDSRAIQALVQNFEDPKVGCVSGELCFKRRQAEQTGSIAEGMSRYWNYEKFLRKHESKIGSMLGATGAIYAIRTELFSPLPPDIVVDDMYIPFTIIKLGYRAIFESEARAHDSPSERPIEEFQRKVRTLAGNYQIFGFFLDLLIPFKSPIAWQLISHKFLRLIVPFFLFGLFVSNVFLVTNPVYALMLAGQLFFYLLAVVEGYGNQTGKTKKGLGYIPYVFCLLNFCALVGLIRFIKGTQKITWEKAYV